MNDAKSGDADGKSCDVFSTISIGVSTSAGIASFVGPAVVPGWQAIHVGGLTTADFFSRDFAGANDLIFGVGFDLLSGKYRASWRVDGPCGSHARPG